MTLRHSAKTKPMRSSHSAHVTCKKALDNPKCCARLAQPTSEEVETNAVLHLYSPSLHDNLWSWKITLDTIC